MQRYLEELIRKALEEDIGQEDLTTNNTVPKGQRCEARLYAKQDGILSGIKPFYMTFTVIGAEVDDWGACEDGHAFKEGDLLADFTANTREVLTAERTAMNFIQHLSGVATLTNKFVSKLEGMRCRVCDTRKTTPLMRQLEKAAVVHGGGFNHRHTLFNGILIKENHITAAGGVRTAIAKASEGTHHLMRIGIEVRTLEEFDEALDAGADVIMLDNLDLESMREAKRRTGGRKVLLEASGNASLDRVRAMAETGVDVVSVGALTHSAPAVDMSLIIENV